MKTTLIALLLTQLVVLAGCSDLKRIWDIFISTRENPVTIDRIWDVHEKDRRLLLVMVHGFDSSNDQAWGEFPNIIKSKKDTAFVRFNVLRYGWGSSACRNEVDIADRGDGLNSFLSDELKNYDGMIIMGHSLGGLVAMYGLTKLAKAHNPELARTPVTVMTIGTPYSGVPGAELLENFAVVCTDKQAEAVTVFNRSLRDLKEDWESYFGNNESKYHVTIKPFYGAADRLVVKDNACGPFPGCEQVVDGENHVMIVRPSDTNHSAYTKLRVQMERMEHSVRTRVTTTTGVPIDLDDIKVLFECDRKDFIKMIPAEGGPYATVFFHAEKYFINSPSGRFYSVIQRLGIPGQANMFSDPERNGGRGMVCQITSHEKYPILNIELDFDLRFKEPIYNPGHAIIGGAIKSEVPWTSVIEKVEPNEKFVFYLINYSDYFLEADTPDWIYFHRLGEFETRRTARLPSVRGRGRLNFQPSIYPVPPKRRPSDVPN